MENRTWMGLLVVLAACGEPELPAQPDAAGKAAAGAPAKPQTMHKAGAGGSAGSAGAAKKAGNAGSAAKAAGAGGAAGGRSMAQAVELKDLHGGLELDAESGCEVSDEPVFNIPVEKVEVLEYRGGTRPLSLHSGNIKLDKPSELMLGIIRNHGETPICEEYPNLMFDLTLADGSTETLSPLLLLATVPHEASDGFHMCIPACGYSAIKLNAVIFPEPARVVGAKVSRISLQWRGKAVADAKPGPKVSASELTWNTQRTRITATLTSERTLYEPSFALLGFRTGTAWPLSWSSGDFTRELGPDQPFRDEYTLPALTDAIDWVTPMLLSASTFPPQCDPVHPDQRSEDFSVCGVGYCLPAVDAKSYSTCDEDAAASVAVSGTCAKLTDCQSGNACLDGVCTPWCRSASDCPEPFTTCELGYKRYAQPNDEIGICSQ